DRRGVHAPAGIAARNESRELSPNPGANGKPRPLRAMPTLRAPSIAGVAFVALLPALALGAAACSPPAATPLPGPTCVPAPAGSPAAAIDITGASASAGTEASAGTPSAAPHETLFTPNPNATPIDAASG